MSIYKIFRNAELQAGFADLIFKQETEGLYDFLEIYMVRKTAYIVVGLDDRTLAKTALDHIRVDGTLHQEVYGADLLCLFLKNANKLFADNLTFLFGFSDTCKLLIEALLGIDADKVKVIGTIGAKDRFYLIAFVLAEKAVIYEDTSKLLAHCLGHQDCCHRGIHAAGKCTKHLAVSDLFADLLNGSLHEGIHAPVTLAVTDIVYKIGKHLHTFLCVHYLRMELYRIDLLVRIFHCCHGADRRVCGNLEICGSLFDIIRMAHPTDCLV